jgi:hypothetical protein
MRIDLKASLGVLSGYIMLAMFGVSDGISFDGNER